MGIIKKIFRFGFTIYGFSIFLSLMLVLFPLFIAAFLQKPEKSGNLIYKISRFWADAFFLLTGIIHKDIYEAPHNKNHQYIFISNHVSYIDIPMIMKVIRKQHLRVLGKMEMNKIPLFGSIYKRGAVSVNRKNKEARAESIKNMIDLLQQKISIFIFPEGTFNSTHRPLKNFYDGAFKIAIETQIPICPILFLDTYDRLNYKNIFSFNPGKCRAVHLLQTPTKGLTYEDVDTLKEKIFTQMEEALVRYKANWIENPE